MSSLSTGGGRDLCAESRVCSFMSSHRLKVLLMLWGLMAPAACERTRVPSERPEAGEAMNEPGGSQGAQTASGQAAPTGVGTLSGRVVFRGPLPDSTTLFVPEAGEIFVIFIFASSAIRRRLLLRHIMDLSAEH